MLAGARAATADPGAHDAQDQQLRSLHANCRRHQQTPPGGPARSSWPASAHWTRQSRMPAAACSTVRSHGRRPGPPVRAGRL